MVKDGQGWSRMVKDAKGYSRMLKDAQRCLKVKKVPTYTSLVKDEH